MASKNNTADKYKDCKKLSEKTVRSEIVKAGFADPLDPNEEDNQLDALTVKDIEFDEKLGRDVTRGEFRLPIVGFEPKFPTKKITINQVTQEETKDHRVATIKASIERTEKLFKERGDTSSSALRAPIIIQRVFKGFDESGAPLYSYLLFSGHNRRKAFTEYYDCEHVPAIIVDDLESIDGTNIDKNTKDRMTRKVRRDANPQPDVNEYDNYDIAKIVHDEVTAEDYAGIVPTDRDSFSQVMDKIFYPRRIKPRPQCRSAIYKAYQKIEGTYVYADITSATIAADTTDFGYPNPKFKKTLRKNGAIIEDGNSKFVWMKTDTGGTHIETAVGVLLKRFGEEQAYADRISREGISDILLHLQIKKFEPEVASLRTARDNAVDDLKKWNNTFSKLNIPFRFRAVVFPRQLIGAYSDSNSVVKIED